MSAVECDHTQRINTYGSRGHGSTLLDDRHSVMGRFGQRVRVSRSWALMVVLLTWGAYGLCTSIVIQPGCPYHEVADPCKSATYSTGIVVTMAQCARSEVGFFLSPSSQVGFGTKQGLTPICAVNDCSADQCLKTSQACPPAGANDDSEPVTTECVAAESTVDIQPLQAVCYSLLLAVALSMWASGRPIDPSNARIAATLVMVFAVYNLTQNIRIMSSCDWSDVPTSECQNIPQQLVKLDFCGVDMAYSPFVTNPPPSPAGDNGCLMNGCSPRECLRTTTSCTGHDTTYECVPPAVTSDAQPGVVAAETVIFILGLVLMVRNSPLGWYRMIALVLVVWGTHNVGRNVEFVRACDYSAVQNAGCLVNGTARVLVGSCLAPTYGTGLSPFALNLQLTDTCLQLGCDSSQCVEEVSACGSGSVTLSCVSQAASGLASPAAVLFSVAVVLAGLALELWRRIKLRAESDAHCMNCI